jgi:hypothetical protein
LGNLIDYPGNYDQDSLVVPVYLIQDGLDTGRVGVWGWLVHVIRANVQQDNIGRVICQPIEDIFCDKLIPLSTPAFMVAIKIRVERSIILRIIRTSDEIELIAFGR